jgi:phosphatidylserine/phosphatidylglycerophosphate/cardiolipin synthase-like enzyme
MTSRTADLSADGFERIGVFAAAVAHFVWKVDLDVEFDRDLRLVEETVLGLVAAAIGSPTQIADLMGLDDGRIVPATIVDLLRKGALGHRDGTLSVAPLGLDMLKRAASREVRRYTDVELRHDPYRDELRWSFDETELKEREVRDSALRPLPAPSALGATTLESRYREVQSLLEREGLPFDSPDEKEANEKRRREIVRVISVKHYVAYREAELEVWYRADREEWRWKLLRGGGEEAEVSEKLAELESEGHEIIPLEERRELTLGPQAAEVHATAEQVRQSPAAGVLETHEHREALRDAILEARRELIIVSPWLRTAAVDHELLAWLGTSLDRNKELRIVVGYGIERAAAAKRQDPAVRDQEEALRRLRDMGERAHGRLRVVEVGNTHEKLVICDDQYVILTSFNFLSFNPRPGKGLRREMGYRITDAAMVADVRARVGKVLAG